jgi:molecular chaperone GrpE (heat shock protein)
MKTEKAIQVLRDYNLWRRGNEDMEQPDQYTIGEAIDDVLMAIDNMEEEAKLHRGAITGWQNKWERAVELAAKAEAERDLWRAEAQRWREQALDLEAQIETAIKRIQWRQDNLDRGIKELKGDY